MKTNQNKWILIIPALLLIAAWLILKPYCKEHKKAIIESFKD